MLVAQAQDSERGKMRAGAFPTDGELITAKIAEVVMHPKRGCFAIVRTCRVGVLGREAILDADCREPSIVSDPLKQAILLICRTQHMAAAVNVQIDAA